MSHLLVSTPTRTKPGSHKYVAMELTLLAALKDILPLVGGVNKPHPSLSQYGAVEDHWPLGRHTRIGAPTRLWALLQLYVATAPVNVPVRVMCPLAGLLRVLQPVPAVRINLLNMLCEKLGDKFFIKAGMTRDGNLHFRIF